MENVNKFGRYLKRIRHIAGLSVREVEQKVGISKSYISLLENGKREVPTLKLLQKMAELYNVSLNEMMKEAGYLENLEGAKSPSSSELDCKIDMLPVGDSVYLPILGRIAAGVPMLAVENIEGQAPVEKKDLHRGSQYFYLRVKGDSMNMKIHDGDLVLVQCQDTLENGEIGAIMVNGDDATIKRYKRMGNIVVLEPMSYNKEHQVQMYDLEQVTVKIIGKAIGYRGEL